MKSLREALAGISDYRDDPEYSLEGVLSLICLALLCGCDGLHEIERFGQQHRWELSSRFGFRRDKMPKYGTIRRVLNQVDEGAFTAVVSGWGQEVLNACEQVAVAIDGKTLRGTRQAEQPAIQVISALGHELRLVLGQVQVPKGTNEITAIFTLLTGLVLEGRGVTVDALLTQREIAEAIRAKGGTI
jgi:hypothetical protein